MEELGGRMVEGMAKRHWSVVSWRFSRPLWWISKRCYTLEESALHGSNTEAYFSFDRTVIIRAFKRGACGW